MVLIIMPQFAWKYDSITGDNVRWIVKDKFYARRVA